MNLLLENKYVIHTQSRCLYFIFETVFQSQYILKKTTLYVYTDSKLYEKFDKLVGLCRKNNKINAIIFIIFTNRFQAKLYKYVVAFYSLYQDIKVQKTYFRKLKKLIQK